MLLFIVQDKVRVLYFVKKINFCTKMNKMNAHIFYKKVWPFYNQKALTGK